MERLGWPYDILRSSFLFFTSVRPYGIAHLRHLDHALGHVDRVLEGSELKCPRVCRGHFGLGLSGQG